jgi:hypothetical protein
LRFHSQLSGENSSYFLQNGNLVSSAGLSTRVAGFFWVQHTKTENIPNLPKIYQTAVKYSQCKLYQHFPFHSQPSEMYPNWDFGKKINHLATLFSRQKDERNEVQASGEIRQGDGASADS